MKSAIENACDMSWCRNARVRIYTRCSNLHFCTLNNVTGLRVTDVNIDEDGRVGNLTVVEGCVFLENETPKHGSAVAIVPLRTYFHYGRLGITVFRNK